MDISLHLSLSLLWTHTLDIFIHVVNGFWSNSVESSRINALTEVLFVVGLCTVCLRKYCVTASVLDSSVNLHASVRMFSIGIISISQCTQFARRSAFNALLSKTLYPSIESTRHKSSSGALTPKWNQAIATINFTFSREIDMSCRRGASSLGRLRYSFQ